jgi:hypothetical protein
VHKQVSSEQHSYTYSTAEKYDTRAQNNLNKQGFNMQKLFLFILYSSEF